MECSNFRRLGAMKVHRKRHRSLTSQIYLLRKINAK